MKKLTKKSLNELASTMPKISKMEQSFSVGGGNGSKEMPYTVEEYDYLSDSGLWKGGYVDGWGYTASETVVVASGTSNSGSGSGHWNDLDPFGNTNLSGSWDAASNLVSGDWSGGIWSGGAWIENPYNNQTGNGNTNGGGGNSSSGNSGSNSNGSGNITNTNGNLTTILDVLSSDDFYGYKATDTAGCQGRCIEMLAKAGVKMSGTKILMVSASNNRAGDVLPTAQSGIDTINKALEKGEPIIIGVDYKVADYNDKLEDHFIVIVGRTVTEDSKGDQIVQYHYYDPQTSQRAHGTSTNNILTLTSDNKLTGTYKTTGGNSQDYTATSVRPNQ